MPVTLPGRLTIIERSGRNGRFCVGNLVTELGEFVVKDSTLDQYGQGTYAGRFVIARIYPKTYTFQNRLFIDIVATLDELVIDVDGVQEGKVETPPPASEPDPIEDSAKSTPSPSPAPASSKSTIEQPTVPTAEIAADSTDTEVSIDARLITLFGAEQAKSVTDRHPIKLDPAVDRALFRSQIQFLKDLGYRWQPVDQTWQPKS
ncbi:DUF3275 family protein [Chitinimonas koreensis]|uniref:DUF3275 family protein n=1 Tax=Chitinimonas koreensis TaxID=356302 RepID=UPI000419F7AE|nr:DUF3275 family protein [Chitinimonas koreensis]QNM95505.1 DUF3275 family protein [Chitinimonas koreensis]